MHMTLFPLALWIFHSCLPSFGLIHQNHSSLLYAIVQILASVSVERGIWSGNEIQRPIIPDGNDRLKNT